MKKFLTVVSLALLTVLLALTLAGCGGVGKLQKAYEKEGYTCTVQSMSDQAKQNAEDFIKTLEGDEKKEAQELYNIQKKSEALIVKKGLEVVTITYVPNLKSNFNKVAESMGLSGIVSYDAAVDAKMVKGNYIYGGLPTGPAHEIFMAKA